eukprot:gnl/MRDRNA2_/MRDRNA2_73879_c0_seq2.p1 gnl/MRDRNA2_/MRDRNA2_73879_c0~~gnl/MRDRNA2_/MRDRNA2_73879_c0_seq2.p1  ORF type:complete len:151 (+),score=56.70 gnl/MRDRNA2_/MRDRNA2_73879_c0_seq2:97-549(+)
MAGRCFTLALALLAGSALSNNQLRASEKAAGKEQARAKMRSHMLASAQANMKIRANLQLFAAKAQKFGIKLPWANLDADGGEEMEFGNQHDDITDPKLFSESQYEHTSATDDADVAETEDDDENDGEDDSFKHGDDSLSHDDDSDDSDSE